MRTAFRRSLGGLWLLCIFEAAPAQIMFTHDVGTAGLSSTPPNAIFEQTDVADVFYSRANAARATTQNRGNERAYDSDGQEIPAFNMGLAPGDQIDALQIGFYEFDRSTVLSLGLYFSVRPGAVGLPGSPVAGDAPDNGAHVYASSSLGFHDTVIRAVEMGLTGASDIDGMTVGKQVKTARKNPSEAPIFFSLAAGSPSLVTFSANPGDILMANPGSIPDTSVFITGTELGLNSADELDAMVILGTMESPVVMFSVGDGAIGIPGGAVSVGGPGDVYFSVLSGLSFFFRTASMLGLNDDDDIDALDLLVQGKVRVPSGDPPPSSSPDRTCPRGGIEFTLRAEPGNGSFGVGVPVQDSLGNLLPSVVPQMTVNEFSDEGEVGLKMLIAASSFFVRDPTTQQLIPVFEPKAKIKSQEQRDGTLETAILLKTHRTFNAMGFCLAGGAVNFQGAVVAASIEVRKIPYDRIFGAQLQLFFDGVANQDATLRLQLGESENVYEIEVLTGDDHAAITAKIALVLDGWVTVWSPPNPLLIVLDDQGAPVANIPLLEVDRPYTGIRPGVIAIIFPEI